MAGDAPTQDVILIYPNPKLRRTAQPVAEITPKVRARIEGMFPLMYEANGIGLAAPQVGWNVRLFVMNVTGKPEGAFAIVNPEVVDKGGGFWTLEEGCLSLPKIYGKVKREKHVVMRGLDLDGNEVEVEADGMIGRCMLHEFDHLDGILFIDRLTAAKKQSLKRKLRVLEDEFADAGTPA